MSGVLEGDIWTQTYTQGETQVDMKAEIGQCVCHPGNTKDGQKAPEARERGLGQILLQNLQKEPTLPTS